MKLRVNGFQGEVRAAPEPKLVRMPHLSAASGPRDVPLLEETLGTAFDRIANTFAEREAVVSTTSGERLTYRELQAETDAFARGLIGLGVRHGDRVGIWSTNNVEWVIAQFATPKIGAILVNINPAYRSSEARYALAASGVSVLLMQVRYKTSAYARMLGEIRAELPDLRHVVLIGDDELDAPLEALRWEDVPMLAGAHVKREVLAERLAATRPDDAINIQYTSGTTGFPKGATLSHRGILNNGYFIGEGCRYTERDRVCVPVPFYHCFGMVLGNLAIVTHGAAIVIPNPTFDAAKTLEAVANERCTSLYGVPTMFIAELALPSFAEFDLRSLRTGIMAGSPCPLTVMQRVRTEMHMADVTICYGMTETSPVSTQTSIDDSIEKRTSTVGRVSPHVEIKLVGEDGAIVECGRPGELCTRGYSVMLGYWNDPANTARAIDADGFMHTGDIAVMDAEGYINIAGRKGDLVIRGGENIYPREIEEVLYRHPGVSDVAVIGVPDERYVEELCAWVIPKADAKLDDESIKAFCRERIAHYKVPRYVLFVDELPMTVSGKVQKYKMREHSIETLGLQSVAKIVTA